jgi:hypothetical protein
MARHMCRWNGDWHTRAWASARGLLIVPSAEEDAQDARTWDGAANESGGVLRVMWCELCQLVDDVKPIGARPEAERAVESPEQSGTP